MNIENQELELPKPVLQTTRLISFHHTQFFSCVINESIVAYLSGRTLVLENIRTHQQTILWTCPENYNIRWISEYIGGYGPFLVAVIVYNYEKNQHELVILEIGWCSYLDNKNQQKIFALKNLDSGNFQILQMQFGRGAQQIIILSKYKAHQVLSIINCQNGDFECVKVLKDPVISIKPLQISKQKNFALWNSRQIRILTFNNQFLIEHKKNEQPFLNQNENIMQVEFGQSHKNKVIGYILTDFGNLVLFKVDGSVFSDFVKIDVRISKSSYQINVEKDEKGAKQRDNYEYFMPSCIMNKNNRVFIGYTGCRRLSFITYSLMNYSTYSATISSQVIFLPFQEPENQKQYMNLPFDYEIAQISLSADMCTCGMIVKNRNNKRYLMVLDILNSLICEQRKQNPCDKIYGNYSCYGKCISSCYSESNSSIFVLHRTEADEIKLAFYSVNYLQVAKLPPSGLLMWDQTLKANAMQVCVHPTNYTLLLIQQQTVKVHFYSRQKLYESHALLSISKCTCGNFSPLGDKIVLGTANGIYVIKSYSLEIECILNHNAILNRIPKKIEHVSPFDLAIQFGVGNSSSLVTVQNYTNIRSLGAISIKNRVNQTNFCAKVYDIDWEKKIVILVQQGQCLKFMNMDLELINQLHVEVYSIQLCKPIDLLLIGTSKGRIYLCRWPDITITSYISDVVDDFVLGINQIHQSRIINVSLSLNYRFIFTISETGEIGITEFLQQNSNNINKQAALIMLKKWSIKPLIQNSLTSINENMKKSQMIVKAIGKQVQISARNEKQLKILQEKLQQKIAQNMKNVQKSLNQDYCICEMQRKTKQLLRKIDQTKNFFKQLDVKMEVVRKKQIQNFNSQLHQIYIARDQMENKRVELLNIVNQYKKQLINQNQNQKYSYQTAADAQLMYIEKGTKQNQRMFKKLDQINQGKDFTMFQEKEETKQLCQKQFDQELKRLNQRKKQLLQEIRKKQFTISELTSKQSDFGLQLMELENQLNTLRSIEALAKRDHLALTKKLQEVNLSHQNQVLKHRNYEQKKKIEEKKSGIVEKNYYSILNEIQCLQKQYQQMKVTKLTLDDKFFKENRQNLNLTDEIVIAKQKVKNLKQKRNEAKRKHILKCRNASKNKSRQWVSCKTSFHQKSEHQKKSKQVLLIEERDCGCERLEKLTKIKNQKLQKNTKFDEKMIDDQKRLTCQLNELKRYNQFLMKKEAKLKIQIANGYLEKNEKQNKTLANKKPIMKRGSYFSLHKKGNSSMNHDKFVTET